VKLKMVGGEVVEWTISKPNGSGAQSGVGPIPPALVQQFKLEKALTPQDGSIQRWVVMADNGDVLEAGSGQIPPEVLKKVSDDDDEEEE
jgi:hypothetical protein